MAKIPYEIEIDEALNQWDRIFQEALNGNVNQDYLYVAMTRLNSLQGRKLQQDIQDLERTLIMNSEERNHKKGDSRKEMKDDIKRLREKYLNK